MIFIKITPEQPNLTKYHAIKARHARTSARQEHVARQIHPVRKSNGIVVAHSDDDACQAVP
jgi:hypothetical protein